MVGTLLLFSSVISWCSPVSNQKSPKISRIQEDQSWVNIIDLQQKCSISWPDPFNDDFQQTLYWKKSLYAITDDKLHNIRQSFKMINKKLAHVSQHNGYYNFLPNTVSGQDDNFIIRMLHLDSFQGLGWHASWRTRTAPVRILHPSLSSYWTSLFLTSPVSLAMRVPSFSWQISRSVSAVPSPVSASTPLI